MIEPIIINSTLLIINYLVNADEAVVAVATAAVIYFYEVFVVGLIGVAFDGCGVAAHSARRHKKVLVVVSALFEEHGAFVALSHGVEAHFRFGVEATVHEVAVDEYHRAVGKLRHVELEVHYPIVGLVVALGSALSPNEIASVLGLVVEIRLVGAGLVDEEIEVAVGILKINRFDTDAGVIFRNGLEAAIFVAALEYEFGSVLEIRLAPGGAHGSEKGSLAVEASVLLHYHPEVVVDILYAGALCIDAYFELLVGFVVVDVGARGQESRYGHSLLAHHEAALKQRLVGLVLTIDSEQIVS